MQLTKSAIDDILTFAYSNQSQDNVLKPVVVTLAGEVLRLQKVISNLEMTLYGVTSEGNNGKA